MSWVVAFVILGVAAVLRLGASSLTRTAQSDALRASVEGRRGAALAAGLLERRDEVVQAVAVVHSTLLVGATVVGVWAVNEVHTGVTQGVMLGLVAAVVVTAGDIVPRVIGRSRPGSIGYWLAPAVAMVVRVGSLAIEVAGHDEPPVMPEPEEEVDERRLISSVLEFSDTVVREVMVPRTELVVVSQKDDYRRLLEVANRHGYSRIPVIGESVDDIVGVVIVKDLLRVLADARIGTVGDIMRPAVYVPETKKVADLLKEMQASKTHLAVVIDEYGSTSGLVTIEDLLEELVGEIVDEYDEEEPLVSVLGEGCWQVDGRVDVEELSEIIGVELPDEDWDTVAGLLLGLAGRIPREHERFELAGVGFTVTGLQGRRVTSIRVDRPAPAETEEV